MKLLLTILSVSILTVSCGKKASYVETPTQDTPTVTSGAAANDNLTSLEGSNYLVATKTYTPVQYEDAPLVLDQAYKATIPAEIAVLTGNAGNWLAEIHFDSVVCTYKGGSNWTNPIGTHDPMEINNGKKYVFVKCADAVGTTIASYTPTTKITVQDKVVLAIKNGDSQATTKAQVNIYLTK